jgi:SAM-dependent methyltransferase
MHIYPRTLNSLVEQGVIKITHSVLVLAGGNFDRQSMLDAKLTNVTISNLDYHAGHTDYAPYEWKKLDAEKLELDDNSYDWVVIHAGLHHLAVPALGVCEMFRVARVGILCLEARDSAMMKFAVNVGLSSDYELEPAFLTGGSIGGWRNGPIPNYVYRWTEREFEKVINSFVPTHTHTFFYNYGFSVPTQRFAMAKNPLYSFVGFASSKLAKVAELLMPKQGNQFAFGVLKNKNLKPWLKEDLTFNKSFLESKYDKSNYKSIN